MKHLAVLLRLVLVLLFACRTTSVNVNTHGLFQIQVELTASVLDGTTGPFVVTVEVAQKAGVVPFVEALELEWERVEGGKWETSSKIAALVPFEPSTSVDNQIVRSQQEQNWIVALWRHEGSRTKARRLLTRRLATLPTPDGTKLFNSVTHVYLQHELFTTPRPLYCQRNLCWILVAGCLFVAGAISIWKLPNKFPSILLRKEETAHFPPAIQRLHNSRDFERVFFPSALPQGDDLWNNLGAGTLFPNSNDAHHCTRQQELYQEQLFENNDYHCIEEQTLTDVRTSSFLEVRRPNQTLPSQSLPMPTSMEVSTEHDINPTSLPPDPDFQSNQPNHISYADPPIPATFPDTTVSRPPAEVSQKMDDTESHNHGNDAESCATIKEADTTVEERPKSPVVLETCPTDETLLPTADQTGLHRAWDADSNENACLGRAASVTGANSVLDKETMSRQSDNIDLGGILPTLEANDPHPNGTLVTCDTSARSTLSCEGKHESTPEHEAKAQAAKCLTKDESSYVSTLPPDSDLESDCSTACRPNDSKGDTGDIGRGTTPSENQDQGVQNLRKRSISNATATNFAAPKRQRRNHRKPPPSPSSVEIVLVKCIQKRPFAASQVVPDYIPSRRLQSASQSFMDDSSPW